MEPKKLPRVNGYWGIWYYNQPSDDEYKFKYSGGLGTYCAKHIPLAWYVPEVAKTFFCYGGRPSNENTLTHNISYFDHETRTVPQPRVLLHKGTDDAHDNPTLLVDEDGYVCVLSPSHGVSRPSYIHRSVEPHEIDQFECVYQGNFSYPQSWWVKGRGCFFFHTNYFGGGRNLSWSTSPDGVIWDEDHTFWLARFGMGHYQVSGHHPPSGKVGTAFNYHPEPLGLNARTNLYYVESPDFGETWTTVDGQSFNPPLLSIDNPALVHDFQAEGLLVYLKDFSYDIEGRPIILFLTSPGYESGPQNGSRMWKTARWDGTGWEIRPITTSDSNYDTGCLHIGPSGEWRLIAPTNPGPQPFNPGGEIVLWGSMDQGNTWLKEKILTNGSQYNHTYARKPVNAHPDFYAYWADGNPREISPSRLYFCTRGGDVYQLPIHMKDDLQTPNQFSAS